MKTLNSEIEHEPAPKDISEEFSSMDIFKFMDFLSAWQAKKVSRYMQVAGLC